MNKTAYEKELEEKIAILEAELGATKKQKRDDLIEARFIKYERIEPYALNVNQSHKTQRVWKGSPGFEHKSVHLIPREHLKYPWWRRL